jgi:hypothetical protein
MRLSEPIEKSGYFWLPGNPADRLPGVLRISETGKATLEVIGIFGDTLAALNDKNSNLNRVVGVIENGNLITLNRCFYKNRNISFGGLSKSTICANFVLSGFNYEEDEAITFSKLSFSMEGLDEWLSISGLRVEHNWDDRSASIHFTPPEEIALQLPEGIGLAFTFGWTVPSGINVTEAKITQKAYILLTSESLRPIKDFLSVVFKINNFLCFATDETVSLDSATGYSREITRDIGNGETREVPITIYYQSMPYSEVKPKVQWHNMLFRYGHVTNELERILTNWLANYETSEPAFNLYFASKSGTQKYLEGRFLSLVQGIETLHRRNSQETLMPENEFNDLVIAILKACPKDKQEWLNGKLKYANELPLRQRIKQMIHPFQDLYSSQKERKSFISKVIDTRNYLTHYDSELARKAASGEELWKLCMKLEALFQLHFLRLIGLDGESIDNIIKENYALRSKLEI